MKNQLGMLSAKFNKMKPPKDLTEGNPMKLILGFGIPLLFGMLFQQFYNMVDSIIVGKMLGVNALAAVGSTGSINFMILGFCIGICNGFAIPVAQSYGAKDMKSLKSYITNIVWVSIVFSVIITITVGLLTRTILETMNTPTNIIDDATIYLFIIFMGIPVVFLYNTVSGILRSLGDSITPLLFLVFSSLLNIILDIIFIKIMGVAGAAVATVTAQGLAGILSLIYIIYKYRYLNFTKSDWKFNKQFCWELCSNGVPMGLQYSITGIGSVVLQSSVNTLGEVVVAAVTAGTKIGCFAGCPLDAMGSTMATYGGQNVGAKRLDRVHEGMLSCIKLGIIYSIIAFSFMLIFGEKLALLFVDGTETELIHYTYLYLIGSTGFFIPLAFVNIVRFMIQGLGHSSLAICAGICEMIARGFVGVCLVPAYGYLFVPLAGPIAWILADLFLIPAYLHVMKQLEIKLYGTRQLQYSMNPFRKSVKRFS